MRQVSEKFLRGATCLEEEEVEFWWFCRSYSDGEHVTCRHSPVNVNFL